MSAHDLFHWMRRPAKRPLSSRFRRGLKPSVQPLEDRTLLSWIPVNPPPVTVSGSDLGPQNLQSQRALAADSNGNYAVVWQDTAGDVPAEGIYVRLFNNDGTPRTSPILVPGTDQNASDATIAMNGSGQFVVAWTDNTSSVPSVVWVQDFNADGTANGAYNPFPASNAQTSHPSVGMDTAGDYVVAYTATAGSGQTSVAGALVLANGSQTNFSIPTDGVNSELNPSVAMNGNGSFVVAYQQEDAYAGGVFVEQFNAAGQGNGAFLVDNGAFGSEPSAAMDSSGNFAVACTCPGTVAGTVDKTALDVTYYSAAGTLVGQSFVTSDFIPPPLQHDNLYNPCAMIDASGELVVAYTIGGDPGATDPSVPPPTVMANIFSLSSGLPNLVAPEIPLSTQGWPSQYNYNYDPSVALMNGHLVATWENYGTAHGGTGDNVPSFTPLTCTFVNAPFRLDLVGSSTVNLTDGLPSQVQVAIERNPGFTDGVTVTVASVSAGVNGNVVYNNSSSMTVTFDTNASFSDSPNVIYSATIQASDNGMWTQSIPLILAITPGVLSGVSPQAGFEPTNMQPGTLITVTGAGFTPGSTVVFDTNGPTVTPSAIASDGTWLTVNVPRAAVSGPLTILRPGHSTLTGPETPLTVHSFRDTNAFSFGNYTPEITFQDVSDAYGFDATHVSVDDVTGPLGWAAKQVGIDATTPAPTPLALTFTAAAEAVLGHQGECFGMSLSSQILQHQPQRILDEFTLTPGTSATVYNLEKTDDLANWIQQRHLYQWSAEMLNYFLNWEASSHDDAGIYSLLQSQLQAGEHPLISMPINGGHVVAAYDLTGTPDDFQIWTYNSNRQYDHDGIDESQPFVHSLAEADDIIHVKNGQWNFIFQLDPEVVWSGDFSQLIVIPWGTIPDQPTLPGAGSLTTLYQFSVGSAGGPPVVSVGPGGDMTIDGALFQPGSANAISLSADPLAGLTVDVNGTPMQFSPGTVTSINYYGGAGNDSIDVEQTPAGVPVNLYLATGNDTIDFGASSHTLDGLGADVNVVGGQGTDTMNVFDQANGGTTTYTLDNYQLSRSGAGTIHYSWVDNVNIYGGSGADTYNVLNTEKKFTTTLNVPGAGSAVNVQATTGPLFINATGSNAAVTVADANNTLSGIQGALSVNGQGTTSLTLIDQGTATVQGYDVYANQVTRYGAGNTPDMAPVSYVGVSHLIVHSGTGGTENLLGVVSTAAGTTLDFYSHGYEGEFAVDGLDNTMNGIQGPVHLHTNSMADFVEFVDGGNTVGQTYTLTASTLTRTGMAPVTFDPMGQVILYAPQNTSPGSTVNVQAVAAGTFVQIALGSNDTMTVGSTAPALGGTLATILGPVRAFAPTPWTASVIVDDSGDTNPEQATLAPDANYVYALSNLTPGPIYLDQIGTATLDAGKGGNTFTVQGLPVSTALTINGGAGSNTLLGPNQATTWTLNGANNGTLGPIKFVHVQNLVGGSAGNVFQFKPNGSLSGSIQGGGGSNWLDYSAFSKSKPVSVNLVSGTATAVAGGVTNIANVRGGAGNDTLVGGGGNILIGGGGNDVLTDLYSGSSPLGGSLLIGGSGSDKLTGGSAGDILIGGTTIYDNENANLQDILTEWDTAASHGAAFAVLQGTGAGATQSVLLWGTTVTDDGAADVLTGALSPADADWFFAGQGDRTNARHGVDYLNNGLA